MRPSPPLVMLVLVACGPVVREARLISSDPWEGRYFGISTAASGDTLVIGSHGWAWVFVDDGDGWAEEQQLWRGEDGTNLGFGTAVSISGDTALVAGIDGDTSSADRSPPLVFERTAGLWTEWQVLTASEATLQDGFGASVSVDGDTAVVGAPYDARIGSAVVFVRADGVWAEQQRLVPSDGAWDDLFGLSVAVSGDTVVVGSLGRGAWVFAREGGVWTEQERFDVLGGESGRAVCVSGEIAIATSLRESARGSASVLVQSEGEWLVEEALTASASVPEDWPSEAWNWDRFGVSVGVSGDVAIVGSPGQPGRPAGAAYVYARGDGDWAERARIDAPVHGPFGESVAISGDTLVIGAPIQMVYGHAAAGAAYVYRLDE